MTVELPVGTRLYVWGDHYEVTGHTVVDGHTPAVRVTRTSKGREKPIRVPFKVPNVLRHATTIARPE